MQQVQTGVERHCQIAGSPDGRVAEQAEVAGN
jgi:hypothetical protein